MKIPFFVRGSETSRKAAISVYHTHQSQKERVLDEVMKSPRTCDEVEILLGISHQACSARLRELYLEGFVEKGTTRKTRSGRLAVIYSVKEQEDLELFKTPKDEAPY